MYLSTEDVTRLVTNKQDAEEVIAALLAKFAGQSAEDRLVTEARWARQSANEVARRTASNLLTSFVSRRYQAGE